MSIIGFFLFCIGPSVPLRLSPSNSQQTQDVILTVDSGIHMFPLPVEAREELSDVGSGLNITTMGSTTSRRPIQWFHFSKAGGSLMCEVARHVENVVKPHLNCNWKEVDFRATRQVNCADRKQYYRFSNFTYGQIERPFEEKDHCPDTFLYGTMLRDPLRLAESRMNFDFQFNYKNVLTCVENRWNCDYLAPRVQYLYFDNFMTRYALGPAAMSLPLGQINHTHVEAAIKVLSKFDLVVRLEDLKKETTQKQMAGFFRWKLNITNMTRKVQASMIKLEFTEDEEKRIRALLQHDYRLYEYFNGQDNLT